MKKIGKAVDLRTLVAGLKIFSLIEARCACGLWEMLLVQNLVYTLLNGGEGACLVCTCWLHRAFKILDKTAEDIDQQFLPHSM